jgi:hypothetical protein
MISHFLTYLPRSIPIQSIAINGPSLVHKVRYVASTLLDAVRRAESAPATAARAHAYLCEWLSPGFFFFPHHPFGSNISLTSLSRGLPFYSVRNREELLVSVTSRRSCRPSAHSWHLPSLLFFFLLLQARRNRRRKLKCRWHWARIRHRRSGTLREWRFRLLRLVAPLDALRGLGRLRPTPNTFFL